VREDRDEDPLLEAIAQPLGVIPAPLEDAVEPAALSRGVLLVSSFSGKLPNI